MKHANSRGSQLDLSLRSHGRARQCRRDFRAEVDRLVDALNATGKPHETLSVTRSMAQQIRALVAYPTEPLTYREHPVVIREDLEKL